LLEKWSARGVSKVSSAKRKKKSPVVANSFSRQMGTLSFVSPHKTQKKVARRSSISFVHAVDIPPLRVLNESKHPISCSVDESEYFVRSIASYRRFCSVSSRESRITKDDKNKKDAWANGRDCETENSGAQRARIEARVQ